jgi:hypothetical protein
MDEILHKPDWKYYKHISDFLHMHISGIQVQNTISLTFKTYYSLTGLFDSPY